MPSDIRSQILFPLWGSPAVPLFLIIQVFHAYKRESDTIVPDFGKIWTRIARPFIVVELVIIAIMLYKDYWSAHTFPTLRDFLYMLTGGPGTYYPWIYLQFAILLPLLRPLLRINSTFLLVAFLLLSQLAEVLCALSAMPEWIYRLTVFRYLFLIYLGYLLAAKGYYINGKTVILSVVSVVSVFLFAYSDFNFHPVFYNVSAWSTCHWICYIYMAFGMMVGLRWLYAKMANGILASVVRQIGKKSYDIYLFQLFFFTVIQ